MLARPYVDTVKGSAFPNMKELRTAHDKRGFYEKLIRKADELYREHLRSMKK